MDMLIIFQKGIKMDIKGVSTLAFKPGEHFKMNWLYLKTIIPKKPLEFILKNIAIPKH